MSREELLAWVGIILGLPGAIALFFSGRIVVGCLVALFVIALIWFRWMLNRPTFTLLEISKILTFPSPSPSRATIKRHQRAKANQPATEFWIRGICADGQIQNILIDGASPYKAHVETSLIRICKHFDHPLERGQEDSMMIEYELLESFTKSREQFMHDVDNPTRKLILQVNFHKDKPCKRADLFVQYSGTEKKLKGKTQLSDDYTTLRAVIENPKIGSSYVLEWDW